MEIVQSIFDVFVSHVLAEVLHPVGKVLARFNAFFDVLYREQMAQPVGSESFSFDIEQTGLFQDSVKYLYDVAAVIAQFLAAGLEEILSPRQYG